MKHKMRLHNSPFELIKNGTKTIEMRLNDEKRQLISIGDTIEFENRITKEIILTEVTDLHKYNNFEELYPNFNKISLGYKKDEIASPKDMEQYYTKEEQNKYGVIGIEVKLLNQNKKEIIINNDNLSIKDITNVVRRAKILFVNNEELTLCYSNYNYFLIGGHNDKDESDIDCLKREILEETGVEINLDNLLPFMTIKYLNKDYPVTGKNTFTMANYYVIDYKLIPNYSNMNLTTEEKEHNFKIVNINKNLIIDTLENSLEIATRKNVTLDTIKVIKEYLNKQSN